MYTALIITVYNFLNNRRVLASIRKNSSNKWSLVQRSLFNNITIIVVSQFDARELVLLILIPLNKSL